MILQAVGISLLALGVAVLLVLAGGIAWDQIKRLAYLSRLDRWAEDVAPWQ